MINMVTDIFDFDSCLNRRESNQVRYWGSEGYVGASCEASYVKCEPISRKKRKAGNHDYPKKGKPKTSRVKRKKLSSKQLNGIRIGTHLKLFWPPTKSWSYGEVKHVYDDGMYEIACHDDPVDQGALCYYLKDYTFKITHSPEEAEHYNPEAPERDPNPKTPRLSPLKAKKRKSFEISTNSKLCGMIKQADVPEKMFRNIIIPKKIKTTKGERLPYKIRRKVLVEKQMPAQKQISHPDADENPDSGRHEYPSSDTRADAELNDGHKTASSVVVSLNRSR